LSAELTKTHSFRLFFGDFAILPTGNMVRPFRRNYKTSCSHAVPCNTRFIYYRSF